MQKVETSLDAPDISIFTVNDQVLALKIEDFEPEDNSEFLAVVDQLAAMGSLKNAPFLILDVRGNGGGDICLGYDVINRLVNERHPEGVYDIIHSDLNGLLAKAGATSTKDEILYSPNWWTGQNSVVYQDISWYNPGQNYTRGGVNGTYTSKIYHACSYPSVPPTYLFKQIAVLSDGMCGSTCAVFTTHLDEVDNVITVAMGGFPNTKMQYFSFPGGEVISLADIIDIAKYLGVNDTTVVPPPFLNTAVFRFALLEIYPWFKNQTVNMPLEFVFRPAEYRMDIWPMASETPEYQEQVYLEVAKYFTHL